MGWTARVALACSGGERLQAVARNLRGIRSPSRRPPNMDGTQSPARGILSRLRFALGIALALSMAALLAESYLQFFPPVDLHRFLGDASPLTGQLSPDADFGVGFADLNALAADNPVYLGRNAPLRR